MDPLDELYFEWLVDQVESANQPYWQLLRQLFTTEFVWFVPNDDNRAEDGKDLRVEFISERHILDYDPFWMSQECSVFEMLVALSRRLVFEAEGDVAGWFWEMLRNLELRMCHDDAYSRDDPYVKWTVAERLTSMMRRTYNYNGQGGLFPLRNPDRDQREVEIWYQQGAYVLEGE